MPYVVQFADHMPGLDLRQHVPIAIIIVAGVFVIKLRRRGPLERRPHRLAVPARHNVDTIRIERGHEQQYRVVQDGAKARLVLSQ